jgi:hypothetical protein
LPGALALGEPRSTVSGLKTEESSHGYCQHQSRNR